MKEAEILLRKQSILAQQIKEHEERVRAADPDGMSNYQCRASREECRRNMQDLKKTLGSAKLKKMQDELDGAMRALERTAVPPSGMTSADWVRLASGEKTLVIPTGQDLLSAFDVSLWSSMDPKCFVYGDGVWGIQRAGNITFRDHCAYLAERDELVYPDPPSVVSENLEESDKELKPRGVCFVSIYQFLCGLHAAGEHCSGGESTSTNGASLSVPGGVPTPFANRVVFLCYWHLQEMVVREAIFIASEDKRK